MTREADLTQDLRDHLEKTKPWKVLKHCDRFSKGIPDCSITWFPRTVWLEVKRLKKESFQLSRPYQWADNLVQLNTTMKLGGYVYVIDEFQGRAGIWTAEAALRMVRTREIILVNDSPNCAWWAGRAHEKVTSLLEHILEREMTYVDLRSL